MSRTIRGNRLGSVTGKGVSKTVGLFGQWAISSQSVLVFREDSPLRTSWVTDALSMFAHFT